MARNECTPEQGQEWQTRHGDGYSAARGDITWNQPPRIALIDIPPETPGETGAEYVAQHVDKAWAIGYTSAWRHHEAQREAE
jgi:hypothetical protein